MSGIELSRELITIARQGGIPAAQQQARSLSKSQSSPVVLARPQSLTAHTLHRGRTSGQQLTSVRRGGGWARGESSPAGLADFKEKLGSALQKRADLDFCENPFRRTALWEATWRNHESIVKLLVQKGATVSMADYRGRTPLHEAAYYGHLRLVDFFLDKGHPIDCADAFSQTPLFRAVEAGRGDAVQLLLERRADPNIVDADGLTTHHLAAFSGQPELAQLLLCKGAHRNRFAIKERPGSPGSPDLWRSSRNLLVGGALVVRKEEQVPALGQAGRGSAAKMH